ncbi:MAG: DUF1349 domain-containing protein [Pseudomonadota bacterium]
MTLDDGRWINPPPQHRFEDGRLHVVTGEKTDFWQGTLYGFHRDDGHFLAFDAPETFDAVLTFNSPFDTLYDQAGIMLRQSPEVWVKAGIEFSDGVLNFSSVVTNGVSDWSVQPVPGESGPFTIRLIRKPGAIVVHRLSADGWRLMRLAPFPGGTAHVGPMACSPERAGLDVSFLDFTLGPAPEEALHLEDG